MYSRQKYLNQTASEVGIYRGLFQSDKAKQRYSENKLLP